MKKPVKLLILVLVLGVFIGGYAAVKHFAQKQEETENADTSVIAATVETGNVTSLCWKSDKGEVTLSKNSQGTWCNPEDKNFTADQSAVEQILGTAASVSASRLIAENPKDKAQYGLDIPASEGIMTYADGTEVHYYVGDDSASGEVYFASSQSDAVYLVSSEYGTLFTNALLDIVQFEKVPTVDALRGVTVEKGNKSMKIEAVKNAEEDETSYTVMIGNEGCLLTEDGASSVESAAKNLTFTKCVSYKGGHASYGLKKSPYKITVDYTTNATDSEGAVLDSYVLLVGDTNEDGDCYVCFEGSDMIYTISASSLSALTAMDAEALCTDSAES